MFGINPMYAPDDKMPFKNGTAKQFGMSPRCKQLHKHNLRKKHK